MQVGVSGIISFGQPFIDTQAQTFPSLTPSVYYSFLVAPYWSYVDTRLEGEVRYSVFTTSSDQSGYLLQVSNFINSENGVGFTGEWMLVATWDRVHPFPHGESAEEDRVNPYLLSVS